LDIPASFTRCPFLPRHFGQLDQFQQLKPDQVPALAYERSMGLEFRHCVPADA
jgi:hypothetical protein